MRQHQDKLKVLVFPAGKEGATEVCEALSGHPGITVYGGTGEQGFEQTVFKNLVRLPYFNSSDFISELTSCVREKNIDLIFPVNDSVYLFLREHEAEIPAKIIGSSTEAVRISSDKAKTNEVFRDSGILPARWDVSSELSYPVFVKKKVGRLSQDSGKIKDENQLKEFFSFRNPEEYIIQEFLPGDEVHVDCFTDANGVLQVVFPRLVHKMSRGLVLANEPIDDSGGYIRKIAEEINRNLIFCGVWYFQIKADKDGNFKLLEFACNVIGGMVSARLAGNNLPLMAVEDAAGQKLQSESSAISHTAYRQLITRIKPGLNYEMICVDGSSLCLKPNLIPGMLHFIADQKMRGKTVCVSKSECLKDGRSGINPKLINSLLALADHVYDDHWDQKILKADATLFITTKKNDNHLTVDPSAITYLIDYRG